ncbi:MAG: transporter, partial [Myxococcales bacterium]|nr:transporter [Myxococcales bacterium]
MPCRISLLILSCFALLTTPVAGAPVDIGGERAVGPVRRDPGTGLCMNAVHLARNGLLGSTADAVIRLEQPEGDPIDGRARRIVRLVNLRNAHSQAAGDFTDGEEFFPFSNDARAAPQRDDKNFATRLRGYLNIPAAGVVTFAVNADDGFRLLVGGMVLARSQAAASGRYTKQARFLAPGLYSIELLHYQSDGAAVLELSLAEGAQEEVQASQNKLGASYRLIPSTQLYSSIAGESTCLECTSDRDCGPASFCSDVKLCLPCLTSRHCGSDCTPCPADRPACDGGACVECTAADDARCRARRLVCHVATGTCGNCIEDQECPDGQRCDRATGLCTVGERTGPAAECSAVHDFVCTRRRLVCDVVRGTCSSCSRELPCQAGMICDRDGLCVEPPQLGFAGGCSTARTSAPPWLALLVLVPLPILWARRGRARWGGPAILLISCLALAPAARAQTSLNAQTLRPALGPDSILTLESTRTPGALRPMAAALLEFSYRPLRMVDLGGGQTTANTVGSMTTAHVLLGVGVLHFLSLAAALPLVLFQEFDGRTPLQDVVHAPSRFGVGDLRLMAKARLLGRGDRGLGIAFAPQVSFPTGRGEEFRGDDAFGIEPRVAIDYRFPRGMFLLANLGFLARTSDQVERNVLITHQVRYGLGAQASLPLGFSLAAELAGGTAVARSAEGQIYSPLEAFLLGRWAHRSGLSVQLGGGGALTSAVGSGQFRLFASVGFLPLGMRDDRRAGAAPPSALVPLREPPQDPDPDGDNLIGVLDRCPRQAGPMENRGCPDVDSDGDGLIDRLDRCPGERGPPYHQGCPEPDGDGDGLIDRLDRCPGERGP